VPRPLPEPAPKPPPSWLADAERYVARYAEHPEAADRWYGYRKLGADVVAARELGYGVLPAYSSACSHLRLIVPLRFQGAIVGLHGRATECDCGKWRGASRHPDHKIFLYNYETLADCHNKQLWIVENPADALLFEQVEQGNACAVATLGVSMWTDEWTRWLVAAAPSKNKTRTLRYSFPEAPKKASKRRFRV